ncbi:unnamed protein product [Polarella glacialis]|uniref:Uncharacterized protein n=1 Tax=Polarella glacialis TaxID=89957 RepID=A0A813HHI1_POLGL|nr:unnamed protein product [Polarella glacialis]
MADAWENGLGIAFPLDGAGLIPTSVQQDYRLLQWRLTQTESRLAKLEGASCELRIGNLEREVRRLLTTVGATITVPPGDRGSARPSGLGFSGMSVGPEAAATGPQDPLGETYREGFSLGSMSPVRDAEENCPPFMQEGSAMPELLFEHGVALPVFAPARAWEHRGITPNPSFDLRLRRTFPSWERFRLRLRLSLSLSLRLSLGLSLSLNLSLSLSLNLSLGYARRADMQGLQYGVDVQISTSLLITARGKDVHKGILRSIMAGVIDFGHRLHRAGLVQCDVCQFCSSGQPESLEHLFWQCPAWREERPKHMLAWQAWRPDWPHCFACCGILSDGVVFVPAEVDLSDTTLPIISQAVPSDASGRESFLNGKVVVYTDGACTNNQLPTLRRAGLGAWWGRGHLNNFAALLPAPSDMECVGLAAHNNVDFWRELHSLMESRAGDVVVSKVKGHASERDVRSGRVKREDNVGNDAADLIAVEGAKSHAVPASAVAAQKQRVAVTEEKHAMKVLMGIMLSAFAVQVFLEKCLYYMRFDAGMFPGTRPAQCRPELAANFGVMSIPLGAFVFVRWVLAGHLSDRDPQLLACGSRQDRRGVKAHMSSAGRPELDALLAEEEAELQARKARLLESTAELRQLLGAPKRNRVSAASPSRTLRSLPSFSFRDDFPILQEFRCARTAAVEELRANLESLVQARSCEQTQEHEIQRERGRQRHLSEEAEATRARMEDAKATLAVLARQGFAKEAEVQLEAQKLRATEAEVAELAAQRASAADAFRAELRETLRRGAKVQAQARPSPSPAQSIVVHQPVSAAPASFRTKAPSIPMAASAPDLLAEPSSPRSEAGRPDHVSDNDTVASLPLTEFSYNHPPSVWSEPVPGSPGSNSTFKNYLRRTGGMNLSASSENRGRSFARRIADQITPSILKPDRSLRGTGQCLSEAGSSSGRHWWTRSSEGPRSRSEASEAPESLPGSQPESPANQIQRSKRIEEETGHSESRPRAWSTSLGLPYREL